MQPVIPIHKRDIISFGKLQTAVAGCAHAAVFIIIYFDTRIFYGIFFGDLRASVLCSVINYNDFQIFMALVNNGIQTLANVFFNSVYGYNYRNQFCLTHVYPHSAADQPRRKR